MTTLRAMDRLIPRAPRRRRGLAGEGGLSLVLHGAVIAALVLGVIRHRLRPPANPASVAVVFENGGAGRKAEAPEAMRSRPTTLPDARATEQTPPGGAAAPPSSAQPPPRAQPTPAAPASPAPPAVPDIAPRVAPPPRRAARPAPPEAASPFASLPMLGDLSVTGHPPPPASEGHLRRGILTTLAPTEQNSSVLTRYPAARRALGDDWAAAFDAYVEAHKYYPLAAAVNGEDGVSILRLTIRRDGTVSAVRVEVSSGSQRLDMAWISLFRDRKLPPFPEGTVEDQVTFSAAMNYLLLFK